MKLFSRYKGKKPSGPYPFTRSAVARGVAVVLVGLPLTPKIPEGFASSAPPGMRAVGGRA
jgi:hypothetical protein